jgi:hypothetical protein
MKMFSEKCKYCVACNVCKLTISPDDIECKQFIDNLKEYYIEKIDFFKCI